MRRRLAIGLAIGLTMGLAPGAVSSAQAQSGGLPCDAFMKNADGSWSAMRTIRIPAAGGSVNLQQGAEFRPGAAFMGLDLAADLDRQCPAQAAAATTPPTQVEIAKLADANGTIDTQKLTCGQLADTYQEDADFLGTWYIGWRSGLAKKPLINVAGIKEGIHNVIVYCKANKDKLITQAMDVVLKDAR